MWDDSKMDTSNTHSLKGDRVKSLYIQIDYYCIKRGPSKDILDQQFSYTTIMVMIQKTTTTFYGIGREDG